jgi:hypothetical protein
MIGKQVQWGISLVPQYGIVQALSQDGKTAYVRELSPHTKRKPRGYVPIAVSKLTIVEEEQVNDTEDDTV